MVKDAPSKSKTHTVYKLENGTRVPGVTTVLGVLNKPALVNWANKLGLQGIEVGKYVDDKADIGTLAHQMILDYFNGTETDTSEYSRDQIEQAENCLLSFWAWEKLNQLDVIKAEVPLVSQKYRYGGTIDCYCVLNGKRTLLDFKTGKAIYPEMFYQLAAYAQLLADHDMVTERWQILRIGRDANEGFEARHVDDIHKYWQMYHLCLQIYNLKKEIK